ncbi:hypothetical protein JOB18_045780 [Solea senegalensis]|uniref:Uncharacterized protein n=1 Tax=Solea senegalensis TaxID=28829 RepID=A0AAV6SW95_SOLSE|nr:hypothetical protein JOB18_045780 [Solea senegalensis]
MGAVVLFETCCQFTAVGNECGTCGVLHKRRNLCGEKLPALLALCYKKPILIFYTFAALDLAADPQEKACFLWRWAPHVGTSLICGSISDSDASLTGALRYATLYVRFSEGCAANKVEDADSVYVRKAWRSEGKLNSVLTNQITSHGFVVGGDLQCFQTQRESFKAVTCASSSPLAVNPSRAEVTRAWRESEGGGGVPALSRPSIVL